MNVFSMINTRMDHETGSLRVTSENMANLHTARYKARMTLPLQFDEAMKDLDLVCTQKGHIHGHHVSPNLNIVEDKTGIPSLTGNTVAYGHELEKANQSSNWHGQMVRFYHANLQMLSEVLKKT